jgi:hypothetical protein
LFQFTLSIEEAAVNPEKDSEGNTRGSKYMKTNTTVPRKQGGRGGNARIIRRGVELIPLF